MIFEGIVIEGRRLGRDLGAPTANIVLGELSVQYGTYAAHVTALGAVHRAVVHVGVRPSTGGGQPLLEVHILDFEADLYGRHLRVELFERVSEEVSLDSLDALATKIAADIRRVRAFFRALDERS